MFLFCLVFFVFFSFSFYIVSMFYVEHISAKFCYYMETRSLIYIANQYAGFYIMNKLSWIKESSGAFCCTWKETEKHQDNVPVKICYHHSFSILFFHAFTVDLLEHVWCQNNNSEPFIRASWVLTGNHITKTSAFTITIPFFVIVICLIQFPVDYFGKNDFMEIFLKSV